MGAKGRGIRRGCSVHFTRGEDAMRAVDVQQIHAVERIERRRSDALQRATVGRAIRPADAVIRASEDRRANRQRFVRVHIAADRGVAVRRVKEQCRRGADHGCCETRELARRDNVGLAAILTVDTHGGESVAVRAVW